MIEINKVICGDALEALKTFPNDCIDLTVTSPPYNLDAGSGIGNKGYKDCRNDYGTFQTDILKELIRVTENNVFYNIQFIAGNKTELIEILYNLNDNLKEIIIWNKCSAEPAINENVLNSQFEFIFVFGKNDKRKFEYCNFKKGTINNVWDIPKNKNGISEQHKAIMPDKLAGKIILNFSKESDTILDPFCGSGTTLKMALLNNRNFIGIDISKEYCELSRKRIAPYLAQTKLAI